MKKFAIVSKNDAVSIKIATTIQQKLINNGLVYSETKPEIVCVVGGDGTFLSAIHKYLYCIEDVAFTGVHTGTLGFFADYTLKELNNCIDDISFKDPSIEKKSLLKIEIDENDPIYAVNEMWTESFKTKTIDVYLNDEKLETFHGSGLLLSTQAGTTAFNRSLNGAVVQPGINIMSLCEVNGIHHSHFHSIGNSLILNENTIVRFESKDFANTKLCFDRYNIDIDKCHKIVCCLSDKKVNIAHYNSLSWVKHLAQLF